MLIVRLSGEGILSVVYGESELGLAERAGGWGGRRCGLFNETD